MALRKGQMIMAKIIITMILPYIYIMIISHNYSGIVGTSYFYCTFTF